MIWSVCKWIFRFQLWGIPYTTSKVNSQPPNWQDFKYIKKFKLIQQFRRVKAHLERLGQVAPNGIIRIVFSSFSVINTARPVNPCAIGWAPPDVPLRRGLKDEFRKSKIPMALLIINHIWGLVQKFYVGVEERWYSRCGRRTCSWFLHSG